MVLENKMNTLETELSIASHRVMEDLKREDSEDYILSFRHLVSLLQRYGIAHGVWKIGKNRNAIKLFIKLNNYDREKERSEDKENDNI